ncbi:MAG: hypothetical protein IK093_09030 [Ruminiclostridium sp.]|nr:hypothetical protein [Ruminiclostridium sp.]
MAELTGEQYDQTQRGGEFVEDEFGLALKGYLLVRIAFYCIGTFMVLGAIVALLFGATDLNDLVSNATGFNATSSILDENFGGLQICMFVQAFYTIASLVCVGLLYLKRTKLFAFIDLGLFVVFVAVFFIMGSFELISNGSAWWLYFLFNPLFSFAGLIVGKHFPYMPMK